MPAINCTEPLESNYIIRCVVYGRKCHFYFHLHFFTEQRDRSMCETIERAERGTRDVQVDVQRQQGRRRVVAVDAVIAKRHHVNKREIDVVMKNRTRIPARTAGSVRGYGMSRGLGFPVSTLPGALRGSRACVAGLAAPGVSVNAVMVITMRSAPRL